MKFLSYILLLVALATLASASPYQSNQHRWYSPLMAQPAPPPPPPPPPAQVTVSPSGILEGLTVPEILVLVQRAETQAMNLYWVFEYEPNARAAMKERADAFKTIRELLEHRSLAPSDQ